MAPLTTASARTRLGCDKAGLKSKERTRLRLFNLHLSQQRAGLHRSAWTDCQSRRRNYPADSWSAGNGGRPFSLPLPRLPASLLPIAFPGHRLLDAEFLAWLQVEGEPFDLADDILLHNLSLEAAERVLHRLAILESHLSQTAPPSRDSSGVIIRPLPASEQPRLAPAFPSVPCWA